MVNPLKSLIISQLGPYLRKYVQKFDRETIQTHLSEGSFEMFNLHLKRGTLEDIPYFNIESGYIGHVRGQIDVTQLFSRPFNLEVEDLFIIISPKKMDSSQDAVKLREMLRLRGKIRSLIETDKQDMKDQRQSIEVSKKSMKFLNSKIIKSIFNATINITNIHIRYEDQSERACPVAFGIKIGKIHAESIDDKLEKQQKENSKSSFKILSIDNFGVYIDHSFLSGQQQNIIDEYMKRSINENISASNQAVLDHLIQPMKIIGHLRYTVPSRSEDRPVLDTELFFSQISVHASDDRISPILLGVATLITQTDYDTHQLTRPFIGPIGLNLLQQAAVNCPPPVVSVERASQYNNLLNNINIGVKLRIKSLWHWAIWRIIEGI
ncbi:MAG: hypothetical protein EZS28_005557 [Streblomastix strix]|uniref:Chorein N-terminal domain-containing protein n=1 Tax=Streblomastix strix TaxID=222440 RepID=A0A5J4WVA7_9EUKA|nr:MAG: hypothetical protein EZS28_005557 [Streblomastix strix]